MTPSWNEDQLDNIKMNYAVDMTPDWWTLGYHPSETCEQCNLKGITGSDENGDPILCDCFVAYPDSPPEE